MASTVLTSLNVYLNISCSPVCDFVDGRIEERNVGEHEHAALPTTSAGVGTFLNSGDITAARRLTRLNGQL
jgi:hypothetical protein